jgi:hypothetical protein
MVNYKSFFLFSKVFYNNWEISISKKGVERLAKSTIKRAKRNNKIMVLIEASYLDYH